MSPIQDSFYNSPLGSIWAEIISGADWFPMIVSLVLSLLLFFSAHAVNHSFNKSKSCIRRINLCKKIFFPLIVFILATLGNQLAKFLPADKGIMELFFQATLAFLEINVLWIMVDSIFSKSTFRTNLNRMISYLISIQLLLEATGMSTVASESIKGIFLNIGNYKVSLSDVMGAMIIIFLGLLIAFYLSSIFATQIKKSSIQANAKVAIINVGSTVIISLAIIISLPMAGINITALNVFSGALGVGLGLSLKQVASNYINGLIMLIENKIKIGDCIQVNGFQGIVQTMSSRVTTIQKYDGTAVILPNEIVSGGTVENFNLNEYTPGNRIAISVILDHETDMNKASTLMISAANSHEAVIYREKTKVQIKEVKLEGIVINLRCWVADIRNNSNDVVDHILRDTISTFRKNGIAFAKLTFLPDIR
ncbi:MULTISPECIES: mechanosensitive ion channel family protein [Candidatus Ichthyocystis]|uniref:Putative mechanosensitive ion channel n=1 Tax=Candidatus Ichthyocystis hellenicum TaxID=1561003 RepID=A0A0S4M704_9BURK|nr:MULTISPECIES: mechanosensitive ion channel domain-containing protein [Ichthyocystis]CUT18054.1 putative mechanosensitive ion channel [Candidatus Ichthyocystis hellenicum]